MHVLPPSTIYPVAVQRERTHNKHEVHRAQRQRARYEDAGSKRLARRREWVCILVHAARTGAPDEGHDRYDKRDDRPDELLSGGPTRRMDNAHHNNQTAGIANITQTFQNLFVVVF